MSNLRENTKEYFSQMCLLMNLNEYRGFLTQWISQFVMLAVQEKWDCKFGSQRNINTRSRNKTSCPNDIVH